MGENPAREGQAVGMIERLSEAEAFLAADDPFLELSLVGEDPSQETAGRHGRKSGEAKPFTTQVAFKQLQDFQEEILGLSVVARGEASHAEVEISPHVEWNIPQRLGDSLGALAEAERFRRMTSHTEVEAHMNE